MLPTVEFDHELCRVTHEVGDEVLDGDLTAEAGAVQAVMAQSGPEETFRIGRVFPECPCVRAKPGRNFPGWAFFVSHCDLRCGDTPTPALPRKRERGVEPLLG